MKIQIKKYGYLLFVSPAILWMLIFTVYPFFYSFYISSTNMSLLNLGKETFIGFQNYKNLIINPDFISSCKLSLKFSAFVVVGQFIFGFALASLLKNSRKLTWIVRTSIMLPWVVPPIALGLTWKWILRGGKMGLINALLIQIGLAPKDWLSYSSALTTLIFITIWIGVPFTFMIELAGLQKIPDSLYEAASIDGANKFKKLIYITIPMMKSTFLINLIMITIGTLGYFDIIFALTGGGPAKATEVLPLNMYHTAFKYYQLGSGAAMAVIMLIISLLITILYLKVFRGAENNE